MNILAIESSCDETACAVVKDGTLNLSDIVASSKELHEKTGGVVPEVAARKQMEFIIPVVEQTLRKFYGDISEKDFQEKKRTGDDIDSIAVTVGPGLVGSLIVGVEAAKSLSLAWRKPLIPVNHLVGHIYANFLKTDFVSPEKNIEFPAVALLVSGGHTDLVLMRGHDNFEYLGGTLDDAAGEAFDKTARLLGLSKYLGGVLLSKKASECEKNNIAGILPRPMIYEDSFDFSFSGLKTAVRRLIEKKDYSIEEVACEFENAVCDVLVEKSTKAIKKFNVKSFLMGGGVAANKQLRCRLENKAKELGVSFYVPPLSLCTDNAVYIASAAYFTYVRGGKTQEIGNIKVNPSLGIMDQV